MFVHLPNLIDSVVIAFLETFVFLLKLFEHLREIFEFLGAFKILALEFCKLLFILAFYFSHNVLKSTLTLPK